MSKITNDKESNSFMNYKNKLIEFNKKKKYLDELVFLSKLINPQTNDVILDFGCGIGTAIKYIKSNNNITVVGYDITNYYQQDDIKIYTNFDELLLNEKGIDKIYFLHSFAHIGNVEIIIKGLRASLKPNGEIIVITPNLEFDTYYKKLSNEPDYKNDVTVIQHYNQATLKEVFEECGFFSKTIGQFGDCPSDNLINERVFGVFGKVE